VTLAFLGDAERLQGDLVSALFHIQEAYQLYQTLQVASGQMVALRIWGQLEQLRGNLNQAVQHYHTSLQLALEVKDSKQAFCCLAGLGSVALTRNQYEQAAKLLAAAQALLDRLPAFLAPADQAGYLQLITALQMAFSEEGFTSIWAEGQAMSLAEAVRLALAQT
jgi:tetratricopeptide (TPR) repeat protein